jgi:hypothetical protein
MLVARHNRHSPERSKFEDNLEYKMLTVFSGVICKNKGQFR